ncbi:MAG: hypothetical protein WCP70_07075 [Methanothrix sp.]
MALLSKFCAPENCPCRRLALLALRPDRPPDPERLPGYRVRLADDGCGPGWPLPKNGSTDAARGLWQKMSSFHRNFAPSRESVISAGSAPCPCVPARQSSPP